MEPDILEPPAPAPVKATRNAVASRARILDAARAEFVTHGLSGARVDRIALRSGANKNLIYHYFRSKEALYLEVLEGIYSGLRAYQRDQDLRKLPPVEGMRRLIGGTFDYFAATPDLIRLMSIENIHHGQYLRQSKVVKQLYVPLLDSIRMLLARGQAQGAFRKGVDAVDLYISIAALAYFNLSNQYTLSWLLNTNVADPSHLARRRGHVIEMVLAYLCSEPARAGTRRGRRQA